MMDLLSFFKNGWKHLLGRFCRVTGDCQLPVNVGAEVLEWPDRAETAVDMLLYHVPSTCCGIRVGDFGCGRQTLRRLLPADWSYVPVDYCLRSPDTLVCDFNRNFPLENFDIIFSLGVLEYLDSPESYLKNCLARCNYLLFSYNGHTTDERRLRQGWRNNLSFDRIEDLITGQNATMVEMRDIGNNERIYLTQRGGC